MLLLGVMFHVITTNFRTPDKTYNYVSFVGVTESKGMGFHVSISYN